MTRALAGRRSAVLAMAAAVALGSAGAATQDVADIGELRIATAIEGDGLRRALAGALRRAGAGPVQWLLVPPAGGESLLRAWIDDGQIDLVLAVQGSSLADADRSRLLQALPPGALAVLAEDAVYAAGRRAAFGLDPWVLVQRADAAGAPAPADLEQLVHGPAVRDRIAVLHPAAAPDAWMAWLEARLRDGLGQAQLESWLLTFDAQVHRYAGDAAELLAAVASGPADLALVPSRALVSAGDAAGDVVERHVPGLPAASLELGWPVGSRLTATQCTRLVGELLDDALAAGPLADAGIVPAPRRAPVAGLPAHLVPRARDAVAGSGRLDPDRLLAGFDERVRGKGATYRAVESWLDIVLAVLAGVALFVIYGRLRRSERRGDGAPVPEEGR